MTEMRSFPLPGPPSNDMVTHHVVVALVDIMLTMPNLPVDLVDRLRWLKLATNNYDRIETARAISEICQRVHAAMGR